MKKTSYLLMVSLIVAIFTFCVSSQQATGTPSIKVGGFVATQYTKSTAEKAKGEFKYKHARVHAIGKLNPNIKGFVQIENKTGTTTLQNAYIDLIDFIPSTEIRIGLIKLPFGIECYGHPLKNPTIFPSRASSKIYRGAKEMGFHVKYKHDMFTLFGSIINGNPGKVNDDNDAKDLCGKIILTPIEGLKVGASLYSGTRTITASAPVEQSTNRTGIELDYKKGPIWIRAEFLNAKDGENTSNGGYAVGAFRVMPQIELVGRYELYDPNQKTKDNEYTNITVGANYYLTEKGWNRISVNYELRNDKANKDLGNLLTAQVQVLF
jgi:hypothetical protein